MATKKKLKDKYHVIDFDEGTCEHFNTFKEAKTYIHDLTYTEVQKGDIREGKDDSIVIIKGHELAAEFICCSTMPEPPLANYLELKEEGKNE